MGIFNFWGLCLNLEFKRYEKSFDDVYWDMSHNGIPQLSSLHIFQVIIYLGRGDLMHRGLIEVICSEQNKMDSTGRSFIPYQIKHVCSQFFRYITQLSIPICSQTTVCTHYIYSIAKKLHSIKRKRKEIWSSYSLSLHIWFLTSFMEMIKKLLNIIWLFRTFQINRNFWKCFYRTSIQKLLEIGSLWLFYKIPFEFYSNLK